VSALDGSNGLVNEKLVGLPSFTNCVAGNVAVGATLLTVTAVVYSVKPSSLSMIRARTVGELGPSSKLQLTDVAVPLEAYVAPASEAPVQE
jgi:hypothetical protein